MNKTKTTLWIVLAGMTTGCADSGRSPGDQEKKPNIIYILADDLGYGDLGCYGQQMIRTPYLDRMAGEGMKFTQHYAGNTVSAPSRCCLMTGMDPGHALLRANATIPLGTGNVTLAELLKEAGYSTALIGKWGLGEAGSTGVPNRQGFDYFVGYLNQIRAHNSYPDFLWKNQDTMRLGNRVEIIPESYAKGIGGVAVEKNTHSQDVFTGEAMKFIRRNRDSRFFLYLAYTIPHANNEAWYWDMIGMEAPDPMGYEDKDWPPPQRAHAAMISYLDRDAGNILELLRELDIHKNTLVMFSSDNGPHQEGGADPEFFNSNGPLRGIKRDLYEGGIRVPMIAWWPGTIQEGSVSDHISASWDVLPTVCDVAGIEPPENINGMSFLPELLGREQEGPEYLYWEFHSMGGRQAIRQGKWKGVRYGVDDDPEAPLELFDLVKDIGEQNDVSKQHPDKTRKLLQMMKEVREPSPHFRFGYETKEN